MNTPVRTLFDTTYARLCQEIRDLAHHIHEDVNQHYDGTLPYGFHLDMVAQRVIAHADEVIATDADFLPIYFGAYFHDSIEDARLTYNNVLAIARRFMPDELKAIMATEIVYALTNEKGRTRAERANYRYYEGIRITPYAPMVKLADRLANMTYSTGHNGTANTAMLNTYRRELPHFLKAITAQSDDPRLALPESMLTEITNL